MKTRKLEGKLTLFGGCLLHVPDALILEAPQFDHKVYLRVSCDSQKKERLLS
jgi:hypothetical protein